MYNRFKELCKKKGVSVSKACKDIGISPGNINNWKTRGSIPSSEKCSLIADYFGVSIDYFVNGEEHTPEQVINTASNSSETARTSNDSFFEDIQKDPLFIQQIRLLWLLPADRKSEVYKNIAFQYFEIDMEQKEKESSLRA